MFDMNEIDSSVATLDSDLLRSFIAVARHGSVTHAARSLHRTQSAVSVQIKQLETRLQSALFAREARGVSLTDAGERLLQSAEPIVRQLDRVAADFARAPVTGAVRVGIPDEYGATVLPDLLAAFAQRHPQVQVSVRCGFSVEFDQLVKKEQLDLAVTTSDRSGDAENARVLMEEETLWVCRKGFPFAEDRSVPLALFERSCWWRDVAIAGLQKNERPFRVAYSSDSVAGVKAAIASGLAVGMLARSSVDSGMQVLRPRDGFPPLPVSYLLLLKGSGTATPAVEAMAEAIATAFDARL